MKFKGLLLIVVAVLLPACNTPPSTRQREDRTQVDPGFQETEIIDVAVLPPRIEGSDDQVLARGIRNTARRVLIDQKQYSVPGDGWIDTTINRHPAATDPGGIADAAGSDAALEIVLSQWETGELLPKGRIYAGGSVVLHRKGGGVLWERTFKDWTRLSSQNVTASNRHEAVGQILREMIREVLDKLPQKARR